MKVFPKDLRIGNYLRTGVLPFRVAQVTTPTVAGDLYDGFILENGVEDVGDPIELTEKILDAFGFSHKHIGEPEKRQYWMLFHNGGSIKAKKNRGRFFFEVTGIPRQDGWFAPQFSGHLFFVHELQNVMVDCGIDKEIELKPNDLRNE